ncbi:MAG: hypothetical protein VB100_10690 [Angelakisella sp.]|nr:hypothetical protein [Angelakisella sp.]
MQTLELLFREISEENARWSYYPSTTFNIGNKWEDNQEAMSFITSYFDYSGKSECFKDQHLNNEVVKERATHIISTFLIGVKLFECFKINTEPRDKNDMNLKYYWFLTCLYHDVGYAYEISSNCEHLKILQTDGLDAIQEICNIQYLHRREFKTFSEEEIDLYLRGRSQCDNEQRGCIDHGIVGGLLLYDKLRKQFEISWGRRTNKADSRESFHITDECRDRTLHLSNKHYEAYAKAADAIMAHNIYLSTFNKYIDQYDTMHQLKKRIEGAARITSKNELCFILAIADTIEPIKKKLMLNDVFIDSFENNSDIIGITIKIDSNKDYRSYANSINQLKEWVAVNVNVSHDSDKVTFTLSLQRGY